MARWLGFAVTTAGTAGTVAIAASPRSSAPRRDNRNYPDRAFDGRSMQAEDLPAPQLSRLSKGRLQSSL